MSRAVRFQEYGPVEVLTVAEVDRPVPGPGQVLVEVVAAAINPGEIMIRTGALHDRWPAVFPSGQGSDLAGRVVELGPGVDGPAVGTEVLGWTDERGSQADLVAVPAAQVVAKPAGLDWEVAGGLFVAGTTAYAAVRAVAPTAGETVAVSGAAGGVGSLVVQLARAAGARVIGIAGPANHDWLRSLGVEPVAYGDGLAERLRAAAPEGLDAFVDTFGGGYVALAVTELKVDPARVDTIIDWAAAEEFGARTEGNAEGSDPEVLATLAELAASGKLVVPIAASYPLERVREAFTELAERHSRGKIVLRLR